MMNEKNIKTLKKITVGLFILLLLLILLLIVAISWSRTTDKPTGKKHPIEANSIENEIGVGQVLQTKYFDVTVNSTKLCQSIKTDNMFVELPAEKGIRYIILNTTFKNIDDESRIILDGKILIDYNGKRYNFDKSETIMLEGWGLLLDQINPLTSKTTNLVYKIPSEVAGSAWYQPGRSNEEDIIFLGNIPSE